MLIIAVQYNFGKTNLRLNCFLWIDRWLSFNLEVDCKNEIFKFNLGSNFNTHYFRLKIRKEGRKKSKRGPAKKVESFIKEKMALLYEKVLDDLLINQDKLTETERVKLFVTLSNYIFPKTKSVIDKFILKRLRTVVSINL